MGVLGDETLDRVAAQPTSTDAGKDRIIGQTVAFVQPSLERSCRFRAERCATLFSAFAEAAHAGHRFQASHPGSSAQSTRKPADLFGQRVEGGSGRDAPTRWKGSEW